MPTWLARCKVQHGVESRAGHAEDDRLSKLIVWYIQNKDRVLSYYDRGLIDRDWSTAHRMSRARSAWIIKCLNTTKDAYENERRQVAKNQNVITKFFLKRVEGHGGDKPGEKRPGSTVGEVTRRGDGDGLMSTKLVSEENSIVGGQKADHER